MSGLGYYCWQKNANILLKKIGEWVIVIKKSINWSFMFNIKDWFYSFVLNITKRWKYLFGLWGLLFLTYFYLGGSTATIPRTLLFITGLVFSITICLPGKLHNKVFWSILFSGGLFVILTPVLDVPDETAHYSRALYISEAHLYLPKKSSEFRVSKDAVEAEKVFKKPLIHSGLDKVKTSSQTARYPKFLATNASSFIPYLPQVFGLTIAKILGSSVLSSIILGRLCNLLAYALLIRLAIKKAKGKELLFASLGMLPMSVYLASSFSTDGMVNGFLFLIIALFCEYVQKDKVSLLDILLFATLCLIMTTMKLPYVLLIGLLLFIPKKKLPDRYTYVFIIGLILLVGILSFFWLRLSSNINMNQVTSDVNPVEKIKYTIGHMNEFSRMIVQEWVNLIPNKIPSLFTFGWLTYGLGNLLWFYLIFISCVIFMIPQYNPLPKISKYGTFLVGVGITFGILMTAYLMWGKVNEIAIQGVQGRYFTGVILLLGLTFNSIKLFVPIYPTLSSEEEEKRDTFVLFIALVFIMMSVVLTVLQYYGLRI